MVNSPIHIVIWAGKWEVVSSHRGAINYNEYIYIYIYLHQKPELHTI